MYLVCCQLTGVLTLPLPERQHLCKAWCWGHDNRLLVAQRFAARLKPSSAR